MNSVNEIDTKKKRVEDQKEFIQKYGELREVVNSMEDGKDKQLLSEAVAKLEGEYAYFRDNVGDYDINAGADISIGESDRFDDWMYSVVAMIGDKITQLQAAGIPVPSHIQQAYDYLYRRMREAQQNTQEARMQQNQQETVIPEEEYDYVKPFALGGALLALSHGGQNYSAAKRMKKRETLAIRTDSEREDSLLESVGAYMQMPEQTKASARFKGMYQRDENS